MSNRTKNATRNIVAASVNKMIHLVFPFIIRAVIIQVLGVEFLGLSSLFASILQVLNLAEMGFSSAITYSMYKPIVDKDIKTICALMNLYKKIYRIVGAVILLIGIAVMPFLPALINGSVPENINIYALYVIYLFNTVFTYCFFAYKSALINAHQRNDVVSNVYTVTSLLQFVAQIVVLLTTKNFYLYVVVQCVTTIMNNVLVAIIAERKYPDYSCAGEVTKEQKKEIRKKVAGLLVQKVCATTRNSLDSIFISAMVGLTAVAIYSNYYTIMIAIIGIMGIVNSAITPSVGNSIVTESEQKNYNDMNKFNFIYMWISGWLTACLICLYQPLMELWMGKENMFPFEIVILFCIYFYSLKMGDIRFIYSDARGLWYENRYRAIAESIANVILNLVLGYFFGVPGIIIGTLVSLLVINFGYGSQILFKHYFVKQKISEYFLRHGTYAFVTLIICIVMYFLCSLINVDGILGLIIKGGLCAIVPNMMYYVIYCRSEMYKEAMRFARKLLPMKFKN